MTNSSAKSDAYINAWIDSKSPEEIEEILRRALGPKTEEVCGTELEELMTALALIEPTSESNNQRTLTQVFHLGEVEYWVTYGLSDEPYVERVLS